MADRLIMELHLHPVAVNGPMHMISAVRLAYLEAALAELEALKSNYYKICTSCINNLIDEKKPRS